MFDHVKESPLESQRNDRPPEVGNCEAQVLLILHCRPSIAAKTLPTNSSNQITNGSLKDMVALDPLRMQLWRLALLLVSTKGSN